MKNMLGPKTRPIVAFTLAAFGLIIIGAAVAQDGLPTLPGGDPDGTGGGPTLLACPTNSNCPHPTLLCGTHRLVWCCTVTGSPTRVCKCGEPGTTDPPSTGCIAGTS